MRNPLGVLTEKLRGHPCEKAVKQTGNEIEFSGVSFGIGDDTVKFGKFSNKIKEFHKVTSVMVALDNSQYRLCTAVFKMNLSDDLIDIVNRIRLQISIGFDQLLSILGSIEENSTPELEKELAKWVKYMSKLSKRSIDALNPPEPELNLKYNLEHRFEDLEIEVPKAYITESYTPKEESIEQLLDEIREFQGIDKFELMREV